MHLKRRIKLLNDLVLKYHSVFLIVVLLICFLIRSYRITELFPFTLDEEHQAFLALDFRTSSRIPLTVITVSDTDRYVGPLFTWFSSLLYWVGSGDPVATAWAAVVLSILSCTLTIKIIHYITRDYWLALIGGLLYALNPLIVMYDHKFWHSSFVILLTLLWFYAIVRTKDRFFWWWVIGIIFGLAFHFHYSLFMLTIPTIYVLVCKVTEKIDTFSKFPLTVLKYLKAIVIPVLVCTAPLVLLNMQQYLSNIEGLVTYMRGTSNVAQNIGYRAWLLHATINRFIWLGFNKDMVHELSLTSLTRSTLLIPLSLTTIGLFWIVLKDSKLKQIAKIILILIGAYIGALLLFKQPFYEHYFLPLLPLLIILIMVCIYSVIEKIGIKAEYGLGTLLAIVLVVWSSQSLTLKNSVGLESKVMLIEQIIPKLESRPYRLHVKGRYSHEGYAYLLTQKGFRPTENYTDFQLGNVDKASEKIPELDLYITTIFDKDTVRDIIPNTTVYKLSSYLYWFGSTSSK